MTGAETMPQVSIVIPTYQRRDLVVRAVQSVLAQEHRGFELIVVDDGSTDGTGDAIRAMRDETIRLIESDHVGATAARNLGARAATCPWVTFLDSDDTVVPDWLSSMVPEMNEPNTALVSCGYVERFEGETVDRRQRMPRPASASVGPIVELIEIGGTYVVLRDLFLDIGGFDVAQRASQHQELALRLGPAIVARGMRSAAVMRPLVEHWIGRDDHIRSDDDAVLSGCMRLLEQHRDRLQLDPPMLANTAATAAYRAVRIGEFSTARRMMVLAVRTQPRNRRHWIRLGALAAPRAAQRRALRTRTGN